MVLYVIPDVLSIDESVRFFLPKSNNSKKHSREVLMISQELSHCQRGTVKCVILC